MVSPPLPPIVTSAAPDTAPLRAILLAIGAVFCFSAMDATVKAVSTEIGVLPAMWARYAGQMVIVIVLIAPRLTSVVKTNYLGLQVLRSILLMSATFFFFSGISRIGLAEAAAVMNINPVLIALGAAVFLGERMGQRRIVAIAFAMIGALIVIRPGTGAFAPAALYPLAAAACFATYTLITRKVGPDEDVWTSLFYTGLVGSVLLSILVPFFWVQPGPKEWLQMGLICAIGTAGQLMLIRALSVAQAGLLAPFNYLGLVFASFWGFVIFGAVPDAMTGLGALVIVGAGLYVWHRERQAHAR